MMLIELIHGQQVLHIVRMNHTEFELIVLSLSIPIIKQENTL